MLLILGILIVLSIVTILTQFNSNTDDQIGTRSESVSDAFDCALGSQSSDECLTSTSTEVEIYPV